MGEMPHSRNAGQENSRAVWPRERRILQRADYSACYAQGRRFYTEHFIIFVRCGRNSVSAPTRMGMAVSRKAGKAVARNRIKRLLRECFRRVVRMLPESMDIVVVAKKQAGNADLSLSVVEQQLLPVLQRLMQRQQ